MTEQEEIEYLKQRVEFYRRDYLTNLLGKADFMHDLRTHMKNNKQFWLVMHDIDGLHAINREQGYRAGDAVILEVANELKMCKEPCHVYRISGDEFMVIYCNEPVDYEIAETTCAAVNSKEYNHPDELIDAVDKLVIEEKSKLKRRDSDRD